MVFPETDHMNDLQARLLHFSVSVISQVRKFPHSKEYDIISYQIMKSATSSGANYDEAQAAVSKPDFTNKISIALKEMRETNYWIRLIIAITPDKDDWCSLKQESNELMNILGAIYSKTSVKR